MKNLVLLGTLAAFFGLAACSKNTTVDPQDNTSAARATATDSTGFGRHKITEVAVSALPASVTDYITKTYAGATVEKAGKDDQGNFIVFITVNNQPKALLFDSAGTFKQEVPTRGPKGGHGGPHGTKIDPANLPTAITSYVTTNYAGATVDFAVLDSTKGYLVMITLSGQKKTLLFNADGSFNQELQPRGHQKNGNIQPLQTSDLPKAVTDYITANYAGATIKRAGKDATTGEYLVHLHTSDGKEVTLLFNADGSFKQAMTHK